MELKFALLVNHKFIFMSHHVKSALALRDKMTQVKFKNPYERMK